MKEKIDIIFVVLVYRNCNDLVAFFGSLGKVKGKYKVIVVDAYYDDQSSERIKIVALSNNSHYIQIPNKGYSYGNNKGIDFAVKNYQFEYLVVSNPDIEIIDFDVESLKKLPVGCYGPDVTTKSGRKQNPMYIKENYFSRYICYLGLKKNNRFFFFLGISVNKIQNAIERVFLRKMKIVYQLHGCFFIFSYDLLEQIMPVFDEKMFLFAEESYLAKRLQSLNKKSFFVPIIKVKHNEDGSMKYLKNVNKPLMDSNIYVFEKYYKKG